MFGREITPSGRAATWRPRVLAMAVAMLATAAAGRAEAAWRLDAATWLQPRSGAAVVTMEPVSQAVRAWRRHANGTLLIRYPGGEEGELWAAALHDWLVALGIPSRRMRIVPGGAPGRLALEVVSTQQEQP